MTLCHAKSNTNHIARTAFSHLQGGKPLVSPMTNEPMEPLLVPNVMARRMVSDYVQAKTNERRAALKAEATEQRRRRRRQQSGRGTEA